MSPTLSVVAAGQAVLSYQWITNASTRLPGATNAIFTPGLANPALNGNQYQVVVTNDWGSVTSSVAVITVLPPPQLQAQALASGLQLSAQAVPGDTYWLQASPNLIPPVSWSTVATNLADALGRVQFSVTNFRTLPGRFYRLATP